jgi:hypothetical protein
MTKQAMKKAVDIVVLISVVILIAAFSSGCIKKEVGTSTGLDYSELVSTLDAGDKIDYRDHGKVREYYPSLDRTDRRRLFQFR